MELFSTYAGQPVGPGALAEGRADQPRPEPAAAVPGGHGPEPVSERSDLLGDDFARHQVPGESVHRIAGDAEGAAAGRSSAFSNSSPIADTLYAHTSYRRPRFSLFVALAAARLALGGRALRAARQAADTLPASADRPGVLEAQPGLLRAERLFPIRQPGLERDLAPVGHSRPSGAQPAGRRLSRRRARSRTSRTSRRSSRRWCSSPTSGAAICTCT